MVQMKLQGPSTLVYSQTTTGLTSVAYIGASLSALTSSASWRALYDEYRIISVDFNIRAVGEQSGVTKFVFDDEDTTTPTGAWMSARRGTIVSNNALAPLSHAKIHYASQDEQDLRWLSTNTQHTVLTGVLKMYTDAASYGTGTTSTNLFYIDYIVNIQFRGIGANA